MKIEIEPGHILGMSLVFIPHHNQITMSCVPPISTMPEELIETLAGALVRTLGEKIGLEHAFEQVRRQAFHITPHRPEPPA